MARKIELIKTKDFGDGWIIKSYYLKKSTTDRIDNMPKETLLKEILSYKRKLLPSCFENYTKAKAKLKAAMSNKKEVFNTPYHLKDILKEYSSSKYYFDEYNREYNYMRYSLEQRTKKDEK